MSWESHLSLSGGQRSLSPAVGPPAQEAEEQLELGKHRVGEFSSTVSGASVAGKCGGAHTWWQCEFMFWRGMGG